MAEIIKIVNEPLSVNTYVVFDEETKEGVVIDPSFNKAGLKRVLEEEGISCKAILLTHGHFDHIAGVKELKDARACPVYIHEKDAFMLENEDGSLGREFGIVIAQVKPDGFLSDGQEISFGPLCFQVLHTPGHTKGSLCLACEDALFTGDTLFNLSVGRMDFPGGSEEEMGESMERLNQLTEDYEVYPGHGPSSSLSFEKDNNPYMGSQKWYF